jgi:hypothetical protein
VERDTVPVAPGVGRIRGLLFHQMPHGVDIQPPSSRFSKSKSHQHVLEPNLRTSKGAHDFAQHLLTKAAERLRRDRVGAGMSRAIQHATACREALARLPELGLGELRQQWALSTKSMRHRT